MISKGMTKDTVNALPVAHASSCRGSEGSVIFSFFRACSVVYNNVVCHTVSQYNIHVVIL